MKELFNRLLDRPRYQKISLLAALILFILALDYLSWYSPLADEIADLSARTGSARAERDRKKRLAEKLPALRQQVSLLDGMLKEAMAELPDRKEIPDLLSTVSTKATEAGLDILLFRPRAENPRDFYAEVPVDVRVRGGFRNLVTFFDEVNRLPRLINIDNIEIKNPHIEGEQMIVEASALATAFRFLDEAERARIAAEKAAKERAAKK